MDFVRVETDASGIVFVVSANSGLPHRRPIEPGRFTAEGVFTATDISGEIQEVQDACNAYWTSDVLDVWKATHPWVPPHVPIPSDYRLTKRQIKRALIVSGTSLDPDAFVSGIISNIPDATMRAVALADWQDAPYYERSNPLFNDPGLLAAAGLTSQQVDALWMLAKDQPA